MFLQILVPLLSNQRNHEQWPAVVSHDVLRHVHSLKSNVFVIAGQVKGKTLLPLPVGSDQVSDACEADERLVCCLLEYCEIYKYMYNKN